MQAAVPASTSNVELAEISEEETSFEEQTDSEDLKQWVKSLIPKDAIAVVNEIKEMFVSNKTIKRSHDGKITALMTINTKKFMGDGISKHAAQSAACEKALRDFFCAKLNTQTCQEEIAVLQLASFAIHKLFEEWQIDYKTKSQLPDKWKKIHPTSLLKYMRPFANMGTKVDNQEEGTPQFGRAGVQHTTWNRLHCNPLKGTNR